MKKKIKMKKKKKKMKKKKKKKMKKMKIMIMNYHMKYSKSFLFVISPLILQNNLLLNIL
jgi:hypothetical protein